jgi:hypothetical protein
LLLGGCSLKVTCWKQSLLLQLLLLALLCCVLQLPQQL